MWHYCVLEGYCRLRLWRKDNCGTLVFSKAQLRKTSNLLCVRRPIPAKYSIDCLLRFRRKNECGTIVFPKAQPSNTLHVLCVSNAQPNKVCNFLWFWRLHRAKHFIYYLSLCFWNGHRACIICAFVFEGPAQHSTAFTAFWDPKGKTSVALWCFRRLSRAKYCICYVCKASALQSIAFTVISKALPSKVSSLLCSRSKLLSLLMFPTA